MQSKEQIEEIVIRLKARQFELEEELKLAKTQLAYFSGKLDMFLEFERSTIATKSQSS